MPGKGGGVELGAAGGRPIEHVKPEGHAPSATETSTFFWFLFSFSFFCFMMPFNHRTHFDESYNYCLDIVVPIAFHVQLCREFSHRLGMHVGA